LLLAYVNIVEMLVRLDREFRKRLILIFCTAIENSYPDCSAIVLSVEELPCRAALKHDIEAAPKIVIDTGARCQLLWLAVRILSRSIALDLDAAGNWQDILTRQLGFSVPQPDRSTLNAVFYSGSTPLRGLRAKAKSTTGLPSSKCS
jgi:hypothetical protein